MSKHDKQTNKNKKLHTHQMKRTKITPLQNCCNKRNAETTFSNAIQIVTILITMFLIAILAIIIVIVRIIT